MSSGPPSVLMLADGASLHTERWLRGLAATGPIRLHLATLNPAGVRPGLREPGLLETVTELGREPVAQAGGNWRYLLKLPALVRLVRRLRPQAIVAQYLTSYGLLAALVRGSAVLVQVPMGSDVMVTPQRSALYRALARFALRRADLLVSPSRTLSERLQALAGPRHAELLTQQYGVEDWILDHPPRPRTWEFVSNRAWVPNSNIPALLGLHARLPGAGPLALIGAGGSDAAAVQAAAAADPRVSTLGALDHAACVEVVAGARFYLSMTASDGTSLSLLEAMALGAVPAVSDIAPNREWIEHGHDGVLLPLDDEDEALARLRALHGRPEAELEAMRARNRARVRERASLARNMARVRSRLDALLAERTGGRPRITR